MMNGFRLVFILVPNNMIVFNHFPYFIVLQGGGASLGFLTGGPQCRLSLLRNGNVPCHYFLNFPVDFKIVPCPLSIFRKVNVRCHYFLFISVDFKRV